jgi:hypothetical protein
MLNPQLSEEEARGFTQIPQVQAQVIPHFNGQNTTATLHSDDGSGTGSVW